MTVAFRYRGVLYLLLLCVVLPGAAWRYGVRDTLAAWRQVRALSQVEAVRPGGPGPGAARPLLLDGSFLRLLQPAAGRYRVAFGAYTPHVTGRGAFEVHTISLMLEGGYANIVRAVRHIEERASECKLSSLRFVRVTPPGRAPTRLEATLCVEQAPAFRLPALPASEPLGLGYTDPFLRGVSAPSPEPEPEVSTPPPPERERIEMEHLATVRAGRTAFYMVRVGAERVELRLGERVCGFTLRAVDRDSLYFEKQGLRYGVRAVEG